MNITMDQAIDDNIHKLRMGLVGMMGLMRVGTNYEHKLSRKAIKELKDIRYTITQIVEYTELRKKVA
jgi:hypothetical protein